MVVETQYFASPAIQSSCARLDLRTGDENIASLQTKPAFTNGLLKQNVIVKQLLIPHFLINPSNFSHQLPQPFRPLPQCL